MNRQVIPRVSARIAAFLERMEVIQCILKSEKVMSDVEERKGSMVDHLVASGPTRPRPLRTKVEIDRLGRWRRGGLRQTRDFHGQPHHRKVKQRINSSSCVVNCLLTIGLGGRNSHSGSSGREWR